MSNRTRIVRLAALLAVAGFVLFRYVIKLTPPGRPVAPPPVARPGTTLLSGTIRADEVLVSAEYRGRVAEVTVAEGDPVHRGQALLRQDTTLIDDQVAVAEAQLAVARAGLARLKAGARPGAVAVARAQAAQAEAACEAARQGVTDAQALLNEPQDLALQLAVARAQLDAAEARERQAAAMRDLAQVGLDVREYAQSEGSDWWYLGWLPPTAFALDEMPYYHWQSWATLNSATAAREGAGEQVAQLEAQLAAPQSLTAQANAAVGGLGQAEAAVEAAQAQVAALSAGPTAEELAAAEARVAQATAALEALRLQRGRMAFVAPQDGTVLVRHVEPGEVVAPGAPLVTVGNLQEVLLTLYVPEPDLGLVRLGQRVRVSVDSYPQRVFAGHVVHIAGRAEFTPLNVATPEERVNTLYAVKVRLPNADGALKPGMPADATLEEEAR